MKLEPVQDLRPQRRHGDCQSHNQKHRHWEKCPGTSLCPVLHSAHQCLPQAEPRVSPRSGRGREVAIARVSSLGYTEGPVMHSGE